MESTQAERVVEYLLFGLGVDVSLRLLHLPLLLEELLHTRCVVLLGSLQRRLLSLQQSEAVLGTVHFSF